VGHSNWRGRVPSQQLEYHTLLDVPEGVSTARLEHSRNGLTMRGI
jgi:hypothetical protein